MEGEKHKKELDEGEVEGDGSESPADDCDHKYNQLNDVSELFRLVASSFYLFSFYLLASTQRRAFICNAVSKHSMDGAVSVTRLKINLCHTLSVEKIGKKIGKII